MMERRPQPADVAVPEGYQIDLIAQGLSFPMDVGFDDAGAVYVLEAGEVLGEVAGPGRVLRVGDGGTLEAVASGTDAAWSGFAIRGDSLYVVEGAPGEMAGRVIRLGPGGTRQVLIDGLPTGGDHGGGLPVFGPDGMLYVGVGAATNSGIVGPENFARGGLAAAPTHHDVPCEDIVLRGQNFTSRNPLSGDREEVTTGAFVPFGTVTSPGQVVTGRFPCSGAVLRLDPSGGEPRLVAWGLRNPFGLAFDDAGRLFAVDAGYDVRGQRPIFGAADVLWEIRPGTWYGWPDYSAGLPVSQNRFAAPRDPVLPRLLAREPGPLPSAPTAYLAVHSGSAGVDIALPGSFGHEGDAFVAQFGDLAPAVGKVWAPVGFKVVRVDHQSRLVHEFAINKGKIDAPASALGTGGLERPVSVRFNRQRDALYVVDLGIVAYEGGRLRPVPETGVVWRIRPEAPQ